MTYLAHSAKPERRVPVQEYRDHIESVVRVAVTNADCVAKHSAKYGELLRAAVRQAAEFHDLGKLDETNQEVLRNNRGKMLNHVDAGVAHLLKDARRGSEVLAAVSVFAHHIGLPEWAVESTRGAGKILRDTELTMGGVALSDLTNQRLESAASYQKITLINTECLIRVASVSDFGFQLLWVNHFKLLG